MSVYVEILIRAPIDDVWRRTQDPADHVRWDLRFTEIRYLLRPDEAAPQRFSYETRLGFGLKIAGLGETVGTRDGPDGGRASALKFWSDDPKSLIREGAGYWRYVPTAAGGVRFLTSYDYRVRFGAAGRLVDALVFRPVMGWATAWSFDRLRLWIERGVTPEDSLRFAIVHAAARAGVGFVWLYQGLVPKLLLRHPDELAMLADAGIPTAAAPLAASAAGWVEVAFGLATLVLVRRRWPFVLTMLLMAAATLGVAVHSPRFLGAAFNPVSLNVLMAALSAAGLAAVGGAPSAGRCLRHPPRGTP